MRVEQGHRQGAEQYCAARALALALLMLQALFRAGAAQGLGAVPDQEHRTAPAGDRQQGRVLRQQRGQAEDPGSHQQGVADDAQCRHRQVMFTTQALREDESVLRANRHDQAEGHQHAVQIALPHGWDTPLTPGKPAID
ncbi:hypothetical protein D3C76_1036150 [compost metagenome]